MVKSNSSSLVYRGRILDVFSENVTFPNGVSVDMDVVRHAGAAAVVPFLDQDRLLLIRQYRHAVGEFLWEIPAGTLNPEESVDDCARRELAEETGYRAEDWCKLGEITPVPGYSDERIHIFEARRLTPVGQNLDADELLEVVVMEYAKALDMIRTGEILDGKTVAGILLANHLNRPG